MPSRWQAFWHVLRAYAETMPGSAPQLLVAAAIGAAVYAIWRTRAAIAENRSGWSRVFAGVVLAAVIGYGVYRAWRGATVIDDAFISFRYARNWIEGNGLVFNLGERVEGYTNFLWVVLVGGLMKLTGYPAPWLAVTTSIAMYAGLIAVTFLAGRALHAESGPGTYIPIAAVLAGVDRVMHLYGTTGMETMMAALLVAAGAYFTVTGNGARRAALAGTALILATMTRPDHSLFYVAGGVTFAANALLGERDSPQPRWKPVVWYAIPFAGYAVYLLWKLSYYGGILPNTFYAKSAGHLYLSQGLVYAATFFAGNQAWARLFALAALLFIPAAGPATRRFKWFAGLSLALYGGYVAAVGGDFLYGRFFVSLIAILALAAEALFFALAKAAVSAKRFGVAALVVLCLIGATARGFDLTTGEDRRYWFVNEPNTSVIIGGPQRWTKAGNLVARFFQEFLCDRGIEPRVAVGDVGGIGFYSRLHVVDIWGLTDPGIARRTVQRRGRPGHEKSATLGDLRQRGVHFYHRVAGLEPPDRYRELALLRFARNIDDRSWFILRYDRDLMDEIARRVPEVGFTDFEAYLDGYIGKLAEKDPVAVKRDLKWFRKYYFDWNDDPARLEAIAAFAAGGAAGEKTKTGESAVPPPVF